MNRTSQIGQRVSTLKKKERKKERKKEKKKETKGNLVETIEACHKWLKIRWIYRWIPDPYPTTVFDRSNATTLQLINTQRVCAIMRSFYRVNYSHRWFVPGVYYIYIHCPVKQNSHEQMEAEQWKISLFCVRQFIRTGTRGDVFQFLNRLDESNSWSLGSVYAASSAAFFNLHFLDIGGKDESGDCNLTVLC